MELNSDPYGLCVVVVGDGTPLLWAVEQRRRLAGGPAALASIPLAAVVRAARRHALTGLQ